MTTGSKFTNFTNKRVLGYGDLGERFLYHLRASHIESVKSRWDVDGHFNTKATAAGSTTDTLEVSSTDRCTDGAGHIMDISLATTKTAKFANGSGDTYYVALTYCEIPEGVQVNPRTGKPEYTAYREDIGHQVEPDAVVDNGNGTITFTIDTALEGAGIDDAGRTVMVWMKTLADGALTKAIAIETCTSVYSGGNNKITTVGNLGQTSVNTLPSNYQVVVMGPRVTRYLNLASEAAHCFVGTIVGNGPAATPGSADTTLANLLKTFQDASQIAYIPHGFITQTNVQTAIDQMVDIISSVAPSGGTAYVGTNATVYQPKAWATNTSAGGGVGNQADGTFGGPGTTAYAVLLEMEQAVRRRRGWTATYAKQAGSPPRTIADKVADDLSAIQAGTHAVGGNFWLQSVGGHAIDDVGYTIANAAWSGVPHIVGEECGFDDELLKIAITKHSAAGAIEDYGHFERVYFRGDASAPVITGGLHGHDFTAIDFGFKATYLRIGDTNVGGRPFYLRNGVSVAESGETVGASTATLPITSGAHDDYFHGLVENMVLRHPPTTQTSPAVPQAVVELGANTTNYASQGPLVFKSCVFISTVNKPAITGAGCFHKVVFENCHFFDTTGFDAFLVDVANCHVEFRGCVFYAIRGNGVRIAQSRGCMVDCVIITGADTAASDPQAATIHGHVDEQFTVRNLRVLLGSASIRTAVAVNPPVEMGSQGHGSLTAGQNLYVDGLFVAQLAGAEVHRSEMVLLWGSHRDDRANVYNNVVVDLFGATTSNSLTKHASFLGFPVVGILTDNKARPKVFGLSVRNFSHPSVNADKALIVAKNAEIYGVHAHILAAGTSLLRAMLNVEGNVDVHGGQLDSPGLRSVGGFILFSGENNEVHAVHSDTPVLTDGGTAGTSGYVRFITDGHNRLADCVWANVDMSTQSWAYVDGKNAKVERCRATHTGTCNYPVVNVTAAAKRARVVDNDLRWIADGAQSCVVNAADDVMIHGNTILRPSGAVVASIADTGANTIVTDNLLSTVT